MFIAFGKVNYKKVFRKNDCLFIKQIVNHKNCVPDQGSLSRIKLCSKIRILSNHWGSCILFLRYFFSPLWNSFRCWMRLSSYLKHRRQNRHFLARSWPSCIIRFFCRWKDSHSVFKDILMNSIFSHWNSQMKCDFKYLFIPV